MAAPADFYTYLRDIRPFGSGSVVSYKVDAAVVDLAMGEMVGYKNGTGLERWLTDGGGSGTSQTQVFVGISRDSQSALASLGNQAALTARLSAAFNVMTTGIHRLIGKSSDGFDHGELVYRDGTSNTVTVSLPSNGIPIGTVHAPDGVQVVGDGATHNVPVLIDGFTHSQAPGVIGENDGGTA